MRQTNRCVLLCVILAWVGMGCSESVPVPAPEVMSITPDSQYEQEPTSVVITGEEFLLTHKRELSGGREFRTSGVFVVRFFGVSDDGGAVSFELENVERVTAVAREGRATISVELLSGADPNRSGYQKRYRPDQFFSR